MSAYEASLLARARDLADAAVEVGDAVVTVLGGARAAGLDPAAWPPLTGAALALGAARIAVYRAVGPAPANDTAFLSAVADAEDDARELLAAVGTLAETVTVALDAALADADDAARNGEGGDDATERAGLCEEALGVLAEFERRLRHAIGRLQAAPTALGETYESVYSLIRAGGIMPAEGRWITGDDPATARPGLPPMTRRRTDPVLAALPGYLARRGWTREGNHRGAQVWRLQNLARLLVPPPGLADSGELAAAAVCAIARTERRQPRAVLRALTAEASR